MRSALNAEKDPAKRFDIYTILEAKKRGSPLSSAGQAPAVDPGLPGGNFKPNKVTEAVPQVKIPPEANTPYLINEVLKTMSFPDLLSALGNHENSPLQRAMCYNEAQARRAITQDPV